MQMLVLLLQLDIYQIISNVIGAVGILGAIVTYLIARKRINESQLRVEKEKIDFWRRFKEKLSKKSNLVLFISYIVIMLFTIVALPFIVNPMDLVEAWILVGLFGLLGLGTPYTFITLTIIFKEEVIEIKRSYPTGEPIISWFNFGLLLLVLCLPLVCMVLMIILRKEINQMKIVRKIILSTFLICILSTWVFLSIWSYQI